MPSVKTLDRIEIDGFKSIREMKLELGRLNLLIGANGAGKSNLVSVFGLLNQIVEGRLQSAIAKVGASTLLHNGPKRTDHIRLKLAFGLNTYQARLEYGQDDSLFFADPRDEDRPDPGRRSDRRDHRG